MRIVKHKNGKNYLVVKGVGPFLKVLFKAPGKAEAEYYIKKHSK